MEYLKKKKKIHRKKQHHISYPSKHYFYAFLIVTLKWHWSTLQYRLISIGCENRIFNRVTSYNEKSSNAASHEFNCSTRSSLSAHHPTTRTRSIHTHTHGSNHVREKARIRKQDNQNKSNSNESRVFQRMQNARGTAFSPPFNFHPAFLAYTSSCISYLTRSVSVADLPVASQSIRLIFEPIAEEEIGSSRD